MTLMLLVVVHGTIQPDIPRFFSFYTIYLYRFLSLSLFLFFFFSPHVCVTRYSSVVCAPCNIISGVSGTYFLSSSQLI